MIRGVATVLTLMQTNCSYILLEFLTHSCLGMLNCCFIEIVGVACFTIPHLAAITHTWYVSAGNAHRRATRYVHLGETTNSAYF